MRCYTGIHFKASLFSPLYQRSTFASDLLDPIMFADDTNLFYSNKDINTVFLKVNEELQKIIEWFISNKLSLNVKKNKYSFYYKHSKKDEIPLVLPKLNINNREVARAESIKFLCVLLGADYMRIFNPG